MLVGEPIKSGCYVVIVCTDKKKWNNLCWIFISYLGEGVGAKLFLDHSTLYIYQ